MLFESNRPSKMHIEPLFSMNNVANSINSEAWFMNKVSEKAVTKILSSSLPGSKQRSMEDILGFSSIDCESQVQARRCGATDDSKNKSYGLDYSSSARNETGFSTESWSHLLSDDDNEEMEKMTLQDMQRMLRRAMKKSLDKTDSIKPAAGNYSYSTSDSESLPSEDSEVPSVGLQLLLEDSTSNSSDNMSLKRDCTGISSSNGMSSGLLPGSSADLYCGHKRSSMGSESRVETEIAEDDEWTLQKWQKLYHKQQAGGKRSTKPCKVQQETSDSIGEVCSNCPPSALFDVSAGISEVESCQDASFLSECKIIKENCDTDSSGCEPCERMASVKDPLPTSETFAHEDCSQVSTSFLSRSAVRLELEDESEMATSKASMPGRLQNNSRNGWALKACDKIETTLLPKLASQQPILAYNTNSGTSFRKASELLSFNPDRAPFEVFGHRMQSKDITSSISQGNVFDSKQQRTATRMQNTYRICRPKAALSKELSHVNVRQVCTTLNKNSSNSTTEQLEGTPPLEHPQSIDGGLEQLDDINSKGLPVVSASLNCTETFEIEEEHEPHQKPAKLPCKRKAISPMSQEFLLKASKLGEFGVDAEKRRMKKPPLVFDEGWVDVPKWSTGTNARNGPKQEALHASSPCHFKEQRQALLPSDAFSAASSEKCVMELMTTTSRDIPAHIEKASRATPNSPSKPQNPSKVAPTISPAGSSPSMPAKGILRSSCQGPCGCEECSSVRSRAERASEFSQRQMHDIEGLAVKLMKDLSILRNIVEDKLIQSSVKHQSPQPVLSIDQLKKATAHASETEETAKKWLVRMARDCNRYCKIMRMQGRKLTFADESGGKLCHVKVFNSEPCLASITGLHVRPLEANCSTSSTPNEPAVEVVHAVEGMI